MAVVSSRAQASLLAGRAREVAGKAMAEFRDYSRDRYHEWANDPARRKSLFRWIRKGTAPYPPWAVDPSSDRQPGPEDCLKEVDEW